MALKTKKCKRCGKEFIQSSYEKPQNECEYCKKGVKRK